MARVASCRFLRLSCSEDDHPLFRRYYARSNRERGIKLLRCFPHCCPEHVQRCYCGTSIHVQVTFAANLTPDLLNRLLVCARFEPSKVVPLWPTTITAAPTNDVTQVNDHKLQQGDIVTLPASLLASGKHQSNHIVWIRADRQNEAKLKTLPQNAVLYVLNNHRFPKWHYSYDSSVTRTQREMTHHLVVYVFQLTDTKSQSEMVKAAVLARHESPGFSLFSHRRSGNSFRDVSADQHALTSASSTPFVTLDDDVSKVLSKSNAMEHSLDDQPTSLAATTDTKIAVAYRTAFEPFRNVSASTDSDSAFWARDARIYQTGIGEKAKHLLILWHFLGRVTLSEAGMTSDVLHAQIRSHWLRAAGDLRAPAPTRTLNLKSVMASFLLGLCRTHIDSPVETPTREQVVVQSTIRLLVRALSSRALHISLQSAFSTEAGGIDKQSIRERFIVLVLDVYGTLSDLFRLASPDGVSVIQGAASVPTLVDEVLSLIYSQQQFVGLRSKVTRLLRGELALNGHPGVTEYLFNNFMEQMQESIFAARFDRNGPDLSSWSTGHDWSPWNRTWMLEPGSFQVSTISQEQKMSIKPSLVEFLRWIYEFACIEVAINGSRLAVRSVLPMVDRMAPTEFQLDGRLRTFRSTPCGLSSRITTSSGWLVGDYAGSFTNQTNTLEMNFYAIMDDDLSSKYKSQACYNGHVENSTAVCRVSMTFVLEEHLKVEDLPATVDLRDCFIFISGIVARATYADTRSFDLRSKLTDTTTASRSAIFRELPWVAELEIQGGYIAVPSFTPTHKFDCK